MTIFRRQSVRLAVLAVCLGAFAPSSGALAEGGDRQDDAGEWRRAAPDYRWEFPRDHWPHVGYKTEWWYFTGHLASVREPERRFGYQFTLFRIGVLPAAPGLRSEWAASDLVMGHASISDLSRGEHRFSELLYRAAPVLASFSAYPERPIAKTRGPVGTEQPWVLDWDGEGFRFSMRDARVEIGFDLVTRPSKPRVFQGPGGYSRKSDVEGHASLYYSFTRLRTTGTVSIDGETYEIEGTSWMDKEFGSDKLGPSQVGWDWFSLQLDDGTEAMLFELRRSDGSADFRSATLVGLEGDPDYLDPEDWTLRVTDRWTSERSGVTYPSEWRLRVADGPELVVKPELADQENRGSIGGRLAYWEGAVRVETTTGERVGRGYVEMTGYGEANRPPI